MSGQERLPGPGLGGGGGDGGGWAGGCWRIVTGCSSSAGIIHQWAAIHTPAGILIQYTHTLHSCNTLMQSHSYNKLIMNNHTLMHVTLIMDT